MGGEFCMYVVTLFVWGKDGTKSGIAKLSFIVLPANAATKLIERSFNIQ